MGLGALVLLAVVALVVYRALSNGVPAACTDSGQMEFFAKSPEPSAMVAQGERCLKAIRGPGDDRALLLGSAVRYFRSAGEAGFPEGALRLGELYDPGELTPDRVRQQPADFRIAFTQYLRARTLGSEAAVGRLRAMRNYIEQKAREGDDDALGILDRWPQ